ncbi:MAG: YCF48-related protein [Thermoguttaceae bacterium]
MTRHITFSCFFRSICLLIFGLWGGLFGEEISGFVSFCAAQHTATSIVEMWKEQNPDKIQNAQRSAAGRTIPPQSSLPLSNPVPSTTAPGIIPYTPTQQQFSQIPNGIVPNTPSANFPTPNFPTASAPTTSAPAGEILLANSDRIKQSHQLRDEITGPLVGNPRDPLSGRFCPDKHSTSQLSISPYDEMLWDACLNDICFVNPLVGWSVGERGVIWHTQDGGANWTLQETPISCSLKSVAFLSESFGIAVGGYSIPFTSQGRGVVLLTNDGGKTWSLQDSHQLPILYRVKILDPMRCLLAGESTEQSPSGFFVTADGGKSWNPSGNGKSAGWQKVEWMPDQKSFGIGLDGSVQLMRQTVCLSQIQPVGATRFRDVKLGENVETKAGAKDGVMGWMAGEGGAILFSQDNGIRWSTVSGKLPGAGAAQIDLNSIEVRGNNIWVAGQPGTSIYYSNDAGKTWLRSPTGISATIQKVSFVDDLTGWAIADLGTILNTKDGGKTWMIQRASGKRLAVLCIAGRPENLPLEVMAQLCGEQGYLGGSLLLFRPKNASETSGGINSFTRLERINEAIVRLGGNGVLELGPFSLDRDEMLTDHAKLVEQIQKEHDGKGLQQLRERFVAAIRIWKPEILITDGMDEKNDPVREFVLRETMEAVKMASDPTAFPYQITEWELAPWKVKKIHVSRNNSDSATKQTDKIETDKLGDVNLIPSRPLMRLGESLDELVFVSRGLLNREWTAQTPVIGFQTPFDLAPVPGRHDFFAGIDLVPASDGRRACVGSFADQWESVQMRTNQRSQVLGIIRATSKIAAEQGQTLSDVRLVSSAVELTRKIDTEMAIQTLLELGQKYETQGDIKSASEIYGTITSHYPHHPLSQRAYLWQLHYFSSAEVANHLIRGNPVTTLSMPLGDTGNTQNNQAANDLRFRIDRAILMGRHLEQFFPAALEDMPTRFAYCSALRRRGFVVDSLREYKSRGDLNNDDVWGMRARAEWWLATEDKLQLPATQQESPIPTIFAQFTQKKPKLDGFFDDKNDTGIWIQSKLHRFTSEKPRRRLNEMLKERETTNQSISPGQKREDLLLKESCSLGTQMMVLYDKEYLYIGLRVPRSPNFSYPPINEKPRSRDDNIDMQDRVEILLDLDRDYGTSYSLTFDSRGWVIDSCWGDLTWNPDCFVARHEDNDSWYIEAAIAFRSLSDTSPSPGTVWGIGCRRIVPGVGIECWNAENSFNLTEGFGFLVFE